MEEKYKVCYSRKIVFRLMEQGYFPVKELPHPFIEGQKCWVFERTPEFEGAFLHVVKEVKAHAKHRDL